MSPEQASHLAELAHTLVTPERYQKVGQMALETPTATIIHLPLPEMARLYEFPDQEYDQV